MFAPDKHVWDHITRLAERAIDEYEFADAELHEILANRCSSQKIRWEYTSVSPTMPTVRQLNLSIVSYPRRFTKAWLGPYLQLTWSFFMYAQILLLLWIIKILILKTKAKSTVLWENYVSGVSMVFKYFYNQMTLPQIKNNWLISKSDKNNEVG
jgi:hypothetical protein